MKNRRYKKNFCFMGVFLLTLAIFFWPHSYHVIKHAKALSPSGQDAAQCVVYEGTTEQGTPYILKAERCEKISSDEYRCFTVLGEMKNPQESVFITGDEVRINKKNETAIFEGNVSLYARNHFSLTTAKATLWYKKEVCESLCFSQVNYSPYYGMLTAQQGFLASIEKNKTHSIKFRGNTIGVMSSHKNIS
jgi:hypothetical protein